MLTFVFCAICYIAGEYISNPTKAWVPSVFVTAAMPTWTTIRMILPTINNISFAEMTRESAVKVLSAKNVVDIGSIAIGEDLGLFLEKVPEALAMVGVGNEACGAIWPQHSPKYTVDEGDLLNIVMLYVQVAIDHNAQ